MRDSYQVEFLLYRLGRLRGESLAMRGAGGASCRERTLTTPREKPFQLIAATVKHKQRGGGSCRRRGVDLVEKRRRERSV
jgi:hypothetical protein